MPEFTRLVAVDLPGMALSESVGYWVGAVPGDACILCCFVAACHKQGRWRTAFASDRGENCVF
jgi:hypothetical protein